MCSQVCAVEQGPKFLQFCQKDVNEGRRVPAGLLGPVRDMYEARHVAARHARDKVDRNAQLGRLTGLDSDGCMVGAHAVCKECYQALHKERVPRKALINYTWQGLIPPELQMKTDEHPDGLNMVELSMVCLFCPITYVTLLKGENEFVLMPSVPV